MITMIVLVLREDCLNFISEVMNRISLQTVSVIRSVCPKSLFLPHLYHYGAILAYCIVHYIWSPFCKGFPLYS